MPLIDKIAEVKIRLDRGNSLFYWFRNIVLIVAGIKYIIEINLVTSIIIGIIAIISLYLVGWLDLDKFKLYQKEAELVTGQYNPFFKNNLRNIK
jgi:hypothetical protein